MRLSGLSLVLFGVLTASIDFGFGAGPCRLGFLRDQGSARAGRALLRLPLGAGQEAQGRAVARYDRRDAQGRAERSGGGSGQARGKPAGPGGSLRRRADQDAAQGQAPRRRDRRPGAMGQGGGRGAIGSARLGAPAARGAKPRGIDFATARKHWAYQPITRHDPPPVKNRSWPRIADRFVRAGQARSRRADALAAGRPPHPARGGLLTT